MLIGIDVGGTYTDGVLFDGHKVVKSFKSPTDPTQLKATLLTVLDQLLVEQDPNLIERIVFSTTVVTNLLATEGGARTALVLMPGPGLPFSAFDFFPDTYFLSGAIDFRGREIEKMKEAELSELLQVLRQEGIKRVAIVGKFSNRNPVHEKAVEQSLLTQIPDLQIAIGSVSAGQLNFMRRLVTTYYSVMTHWEWQQFTAEIQQAMLARKIQAPIDILKADGGTLPLEISRKKPCETIFSGPAASTMGAIALRREKTNAVVLDIGGTTSDISLLIDGEPLYASKGASIDGHYTHITAFAVRSLPLGGDSPVSVLNGSPQISAKRVEQAACFGGSIPCVTDVFNVRYQLGIGDLLRSEESLQSLAKTSKIDVLEMIDFLEKAVIERLQAAITTMFVEWENEPAYKVWEVVHGRSFVLDEIIGIGAAASAIVPILAQKMGVDYFIHQYAPVANAIGACVARPTISFVLHADTQTGCFSIDQEGLFGQLDKSRSFQMKEARVLAHRYLQELAEKRGIKGSADQAEIFLEEQFNVIRGWETVGKIIELGIQIAPGLMEGFEEVGL